jgi:uncharacterized membrane protein
MKAIMGCVLFINFALIFVFLELEKEYTVWWAPVLLLDVVVHFCIFAQIGIDYMTWDKITLEWRKQQMLQKMINNPENDEVDEDKLKYKVETMLLTGDYKDQ